jgi:hypothetical protein
MGAWLWSDHNNRLVVRLAQIQWIIINGVLNFWIVYVARDKFSQHPKFFDERYNDRQIVSLHIAILS